MLRKALTRIVGCSLLLYGGTALGFTIITFPPTSEEEGSASSTVTQSTTLRTQVQPIAGAIRTHLLTLLRPRTSARASLPGPLLAANAYAETRRDVDILVAALKEPTGPDSGRGGGTESLWVSSAYNALENEFFRTRFIGDTRNAVAGFDLTQSDKFVLGIAISHEATDFSTVFNAGFEKTRGYNVTPYAAYLLSDTWSVDLSLGHGEHNTRQSRSLASTLGVVPVDSEFDSTRDFVAANLTHASSRGNWTLTGSVGFLGAKRKQDAYMESDGTSVAESSRTVRQGNLLGELAYGGGDSEAFFGLVYERIRNPQGIAFASGEQPANDPDSVLVSAGWRHFGRRVTANFTISSRVAQDQVREYGVAMMLRVNL
jgi:hypothetical protein